MKDTSKVEKEMTSLSYEDFQNSNENQQNGSQPASGGLLWRMGSGMYNITKGAVGGTVGLGVGAVKLVANTSYAAVSKVTVFKYFFTSHY
ncbi:unnamed protein product [Clavelina lepadiformis]|uniref:Bacteriocin n=1 Tax=Clavelina lepadiformis TaxID=159417 RepID=A0ABP0FM82_CLALP